MDNKVLIDLESFDFDYWNYSRVVVLQTIREKGSIDNVSKLADLTNLGYAYVYKIVLEFVKKGLVSRKGRGIVLATNWKDVFSGNK